MVMTYTITY